VAGAAVLRQIRVRQLPFLPQLTSTECGAACLAMILSYYGHSARVSECRELIGVGRDGSTAKAIARVAQRFGLRVKAYSLEPTDLGHVRLPAIVHWKFDHFVVLERWSPKHATIVDPAIGRYRIGAAEFDSAFTGVVLTFEPGTGFLSRRRTGQLRLRHYVLTYVLAAPSLFLQLLGASLLLLGLGLALPLFTKVLVDTILPNRMTDVVAILGIGLLIVIMAQAVSQYLRAVLLIYAQARFDGQMMLDFFEHLLSLPFSFFQQRTSGDLLMRLGSNTMIRELLTNQTLSTVLDGIFVIFYLVILLTTAPMFCLLVLAIGAIQGMLVWGTSARLNALTARDLAAQADSQAYLVEALKGIATLKAAGAEDRVLSHWSDLFFKHLGCSVQRSHLSAAINTAMTTMRSLAPLVLLWMGALWVLDGKMTLGTMLALNALATSFLTPLTSLVMTTQQLRLAGAYLDRIADVTQTDPEQNPLAVLEAPALSGRVEFRDVSFRYDLAGPLVLHNITLTVAPGQKVALIGHTGSGKSTLALLMLGLYAPTEGEIYYDDIPLSQLNHRAVRQQFGVVLQDTTLFSGSVRQNISANDPDLALEQITVAAHQAAIHDEIMQMPMGYETHVGEGGSALSGGQRQRLAIARALAHRPVFLLLDEATSHLDVLTEYQVDEHLSSLSCTRIVIAHRLSTMRNADVILVLDQGTIVERGTHDQLVARRGYYAAFVDMQASEGSIDWPIVTSPLRPSQQAI
jgi:ABC-type bacteriocin/lantibiotic exporter with double-glycine peptidase domain